MKKRRTTDRDHHFSHLASLIPAGGHKTIGIEAVIMRMRNRVRQESEDK
jgi:hypothetical protein